MRHGDISLRSVTFIPEFLRVFRLSEVEISLSIHRKNNATRQKDKNHFIVSPNEFVDLSIRISNRSGKQDPSFTTDKLYKQYLLLAERSLRLLLQIDLLPPPDELEPRHSLRPSSLEILSRHVILDGVTSFPSRWLSPGEAETVSRPICFLAEGRFSFGCSAVEIVFDQEIEPRVYSSEIPLEIDVAEIL
jgi:hypothetical protein